MVSDGIETLRAEIGVKEIASLIERTARWVAPETFELLPVWYPAHARGRPFYKGNWSEPQMNTRRSSGASAHKVEGNIYAFETQPDRAGYKVNASKTGVFLSTSRYESFGIYFMELLLSGAVGVFQDYPWVRSLLPGYPFVAPASEIVPMMLWVQANYAEAKAMIAEPVETYRGMYRLDRFVDELADLIKVEMQS